MTLSHHTVTSLDFQNIPYEWKPKYYYRELATLSA